MKARCSCTRLRRWRHGSPLCGHLWTLHRPLWTGWLLGPPAESLSRYISWDNMHMGIKSRTLLWCFEICAVFIPGSTVRSHILRVHPHLLCSNSIILMELLHKVFRKYYNPIPLFLPFLSSSKLRCRVPVFSQLISWFEVARSLVVGDRIFQCLQGSILRRRESKNQPVLWRTTWEGRWRGQMSKCLVSPSATHEAEKEK